MSDPLAYFITFTCYGNWLHGDERGSVDRDHNAPGYEFLDADEERLSFDHARMTQPPYRLEAEESPISSSLRSKRFVRTETGVCGLFMSARCTSM